MLFIGNFVLVKQTCTTVMSCSPDRMIASNKQEADQWNESAKAAAMPMETDELLGTNADGSKNTDYCTYCYKDGAFAGDATMEQMIEICIPFALEANVYPDAETARKQMQGYFPKLKRWATA